MVLNRLVGGDGVESYCEQLSTRPVSVLTSDRMLMLPATSCHCSDSVNGR